METMTEPVISKLKTRELLHTYSQRKHAELDRLTHKDEDGILELTVHPADIFEVYQLDPVVHGIVSYWLDGYLTWEQALMKCVVALSEQVQTLMKEKLVHWERSPMPPIHVTLHNKEEVQNE